MTIIRRPTSGPNALAIGYAFSDETNRPFAVDRQVRWRLLDRCKTGRPIARALLESACGH
jgi:hypothetical protein